jgi:hypothetical protein
LGRLFVGTHGDDGDKRCRHQRPEHHLSRDGVGERRPALLHVAPRRTRPRPLLLGARSNAAWNPYRSDCSGFVTWAWGLPAVGDGGYVTGEFAPYSDAFSFRINGSELKPGDAANLNQEGINLDGVGHIILFKEWANAGHTAATFMEEPGCSADPPYAHEFTENVSINGSSVTLIERARTFYAIRFNGDSGGGGSTGGGGDAKCELAGKKYGTNACTETKQCDNGSWIARDDDPAGCSAGTLSGGACLNDSGGTDSENTCTSTLQCSDGIWVERTEDPNACRGSGGGGGGSSSCSLAGHTYRVNTCTETKQCKSGSWVARDNDPSACVTGIEAHGACITDSGAVDAENTCTSTLQCDDGVWVDRFDDSTSCR